MTLETVYSYGPYFLAFGVSLRIKSECGKYGPAYLDTFHAVVAFKTSSVTGIVAFQKSLDRIQHTTGLLHKIKFYCVYGKIIILVETILSTRSL